MQKTSSLAASLSSRLESAGEELQGLDSFDWYGLHGLGWQGSREGRTRHFADLAVEGDPEDEEETVKEDDDGLAART